MSETIKAALQAAKEADAYAFFVADQPYLRQETAEAFLLKMEEKNQEALEVPGCVYSNGHTGNPVWFPGLYREELLALTGDLGGKEVLKRHKDKIFLFRVEAERELWDVDIKTKI